MTLRDLYRLRRGRTTPPPLDVFGVVGRSAYADGVAPSQVSQLADDAPIKRLSDSAQREVTAARVAIQRHWPDLAGTCPVCMVGDCEPMKSAKWTIKALYA